MSTRSDKEPNIRAWRDQAAVLQGIAAGAPLDRVLENLALAVEELNGRARVRDLRNRFAPGVGFTVPPQVCRRLSDYLLERRSRNSRSVLRFSGTQREAVIVEDIERDPRWLGSRWRDNCLAYDFRSCQTEPIIDLEGQTIGTLALYHQFP